MNAKTKDVLIVLIVIISSIIIITTIITIKKNSIKPVNVENIANESINENKNTDTKISEGESSDFLEEETTATPMSSSPKTSQKPNVETCKYYIKVNNQMNTITVYTKDVNGKYTIPVKAMICSTGQASPKNIKYTLKNKWNWGPLLGGVYGQYISQINGNILFHSVPYLRKNDYNSLEYWEYDKLGTTCSAGCIRLTVEDALWIYNNCSIGTTIEFYSSPNPGPLGKPSAMKISNYTEYRGWDPTDPNPDNPWRDISITEQSPKPSPNQIPEVIPSIEPTPNTTTEPSEESTQIPSIVPSEESTKETETIPTAETEDTLDNNSVNEEINDVIDKNTIK